MGTNKKRESIFRFKRFAIRNELSAMKVGTDGVLLGAWCDISDAKTILDVGTGTGLIAIMAAQRSNAAITGIEIDHDAASEAILNAQESPWSNRITIINGDFISLFSSDKLNKVDHIVSNPPYFSSTIIAPDAKRAMARHGSTLNYANLIEESARLLNPNGKLSIISPVDRRDDILYAASLHHLSVSRLTEVFPTPQSAPVRILWEFTLGEVAPRKDSLTIQTAPNIYTPEYIALTRDFYLKM